MSGKTIAVTDGDFDELVLKSSAPTLVDFWAPWCGPCKIMGPVLEDIADEYDPSTLTVGKMNVDENPETAKKYGILSIPTFLLFKDGAEAGKLVGFMPKDELKKKVSALL